MSKSKSSGRAIDRFLLKLYPIQLGAMVIGIVAGIGFAVSIGAAGGVFVVRDQRAEAQERIDQSLGMVSDVEPADVASVMAQGKAPTKKTGTRTATNKGPWLAVPLILAFGGIKFCGKRGAKLMDNAFDGGARLVDDAVDGTRQGLRTAEDVTDKTDLLNQAAETAIEEGVGAGVESVIDAGDDDQ